MAFVLILLAVCGHFLTAQAVSDPKCAKPVDLIVAIDSSGSVGNIWNHTIDFVESLLGNFNIADDQVRVGLIEFSLVANALVPLDSGNSYGKLYQILEQIRHSPQNGQTYTDRALVLAAKSFRVTSRVSPVPRVLVVITDGELTSGNFNELDAPIQDLTAQGIEVFVVSQGEDLVHEGLNTIASKPLYSHIFTMTPTALTTPMATQSLASDICDSESQGKGNDTKLQQSTTVVQAPISEPVSQTSQPSVQQQQQQQQQIQPSQLPPASQQQSAGQQSPQQQSSQQTTAQQPIPTVIVDPPVYPAPQTQPSTEPQTVPASSQQQPQKQAATQQQYPQQQTSQQAASQQSPQQPIRSNESGKLHLSVLLGQASWQGSIQQASWHQNLQQPVGNPKQTYPETPAPQPIPSLPVDHSDSAPKCNISVKKVGCYNDFAFVPRPLPLNILEEKANNFHVGSNSTRFDKAAYAKFLPDFICKCANAARQHKYWSFGIQNYNECYSGPDEGRYDEDGEAEQGKCRSESGAICDKKSDYCTGEEKINFVYTILTSSHNAILRIDYD